RKPFQLAADTEIIKFSAGDLLWSPGSKDMLIQIGATENVSSYLVSIDDPGQPALIEQNVTSLLAQWDEEKLANAKELKSNFPKDVQPVIEKHSKNLLWSPDNLKFLYFEEKDDKRIYHVYDKEEKKQ